MAIKVNAPKPDRLHVSLDDDDMMKHWTKTFGRTREEIAAAINKVGTNIESVKRELGLPDGS